MKLERIPAEGAEFQTRLIYICTSQIRAYLNPRLAPSNLENPTLGCAATCRKRPEPRDQILGTIVLNGWSVYLRASEPFMYHHPQILGRTQISACRIHASA